jgi:hypothetical protein
LLIKDEVEKDVQFEKAKIEKEDKKDLEEFRFRIKAKILPIIQKSS